MKEPGDDGGRDRRVLELYERVLEIESRLIPTGLHVFGRRPEDTGVSDLLRMVASFARPEIGLRALPDLVSEGLALPAYFELLGESGSSEERMRQREQVEALVGEAVRLFTAGTTDDSSESANRTEEAVEFLSHEASVNKDESRKIFAALLRIREQLESCDELTALMRALRGEYIEPGPGADVIQNPDVLPTGRNTHAINPYKVPTATAFRRAEPAVKSLLERQLRDTGRLPETVAMVLWGIDNIKSEGEAIAQALWLMGVAPKRDSLNRATDVEVIPIETLGRPRVDVVMTVSGIFRDLFGASMALLDRAARTVASLDESPGINFLKSHVEETMVQSGCSFDEAAVRVFSNAAGSYGTNVNFMVEEGQWDDGSELGDLFITRKCFAYGSDARGRNFEGREARTLLERALGRVEVTYQNIDTTEIGVTDVDHYFEYLGGVSKAVETHSGARPRIYLSDSTSPAAKVRTLEETIRLETRTKTLNPKWYGGMLKHGFSGVAEIEHRVTNTFGWSATAGAVDNWVYDQVAATYVLDEAMLESLRSLNPHSTRALVGRLLEASGRGFWVADNSVVERLQDVFAGLEDQMEGVAG